MATTNDRSPRWLLDRAAEVARDDAGLAARLPGDWSRLSRDAFVAEREGSAREVHSSGALHLSGEGVTGHRTDLANVGTLAQAWQKAVTAAGGALENIKNLRGKMPADIVSRTSLVLNASPAPGSVVLHLEPKTSPLTEAEPRGERAMFDPPRPLADRASEALIDVLKLAQSSPADPADLTARMRELGPRVASALSGLASAVQTSNVTLSATWGEPERPSSYVTVSPSAARWISEFVAGQGLNAEVQTVRGVLRTVSNIERWVVDVDGDSVKMTAAELPVEEVRRWSPDDEASLTVRVAQTERPDGRTTRTWTILALEPVSGDETST